MKNTIIKAHAAILLMAGTTQARADFITRPDFGKKSQFDVKTSTGTTLAQMIDTGCVNPPHYGKPLLASVTDHYRHCWSFQVAGVRG